MPWDCVPLVVELCDGVKGPLEVTLCVVLGVADTLGVAVALVVLEGEMPVL